LGVASENTGAANSRIRDADVAAAVAEMTRTQILQQATMAVLAQANQSPQMALQLLK
ncbi:MAG: flagellin, partial [Chloroflexota bacterium]